MQSSLLHPESTTEADNMERESGESPQVDTTQCGGGIQGIVDSGGSDVVKHTLDNAVQHVPARNLLLMRAEDSQVASVTATLETELRGDVQNVQQTPPQTTSSDLTQISMIQKLTIKTDEPEKPFRLLDLPAELRIHIYEQVKKTEIRKWVPGDLYSEAHVRLWNVDGVRYPSASTDSTLKPAVYAEASAMVGVNKQVREEFMKLLCPPPRLMIVIEVRDGFSFQHAIELVQSNTKCSEVLTIHLMAHGLHELFLEEAFDRTEHELKRWLVLWAKLSKLADAPRVEYTMHGDPDEIWACKELVLEMDLDDEEDECWEERYKLYDELEECYRQEKEGLARGIDRRHP